MYSGRKFALPLSAALLILIGMAGCQKKTPQANQEAQQAPPAKADPLIPLQKAYGFAARIPGDYESYFGGLDWVRYWDAVKQSHWAATLQQMWDNGANGMPKRAQVEQWYNDPHTKELRLHAKALLGHECFVAMAPGATDALLQWRDAANRMRFAQMESAIEHPGNKTELSRRQLAALAPLAGNLQIPPFLLGFRAPEDKEKLTARINDALAKLPPTVQRGTLHLDGKYTFTTLVAEAGKMLQPEQIAQLQQILDKVVADPTVANTGVSHAGTDLQLSVAADTAVAKTAMDAILTRRMEIAFGWVDDYLLISVGTDHNHLKLANTPADSIVAQKDIVTHGQEYISQNPLAIAYQSKESLAKMPERLHLANWLEEFKGEILKQLTTDEFTKLKADAQRLDEEAVAFVPQKIAPYAGFAYWKDGLHVEGYGGFTLPGTATNASPLSLADPLRNTCIIWASTNSDPAATQKMTAFIQDLITTAWQAWEKFGVPHIPPKNQQQYAVMEQLILPKLQQAYQVMQTLSKGLGTRAAFYMDFNGKVPSLPNVPADVAGSALVPRFACVADIKDRAAIQESGTAYQTWMNDILKLAGPQFAAFLKLQSDSQNGVERYYYQLPIPTGEHVPHIAVAGDRWMLSTSTELTDQLAKAATFSGPPAATQFRLNLGAAVSEIQSLLEIESKTGQTDAQRANAKQALTALPLLKPLPVIENRQYDENGGLRSSTLVQLKDL